MKFGAVPVVEAVGAILAHSVQAGTQKLRKGLQLDAGHAAQRFSDGVLVPAVVDVPRPVHVRHELLAVVDRAA